MLTSLVPMSALTAAVWCMQNEQPEGGRCVGEIHGALGVPVASKEELQMKIPSGS